MTIYCYFKMKKCLKCVLMNFLIFKCFAVMEQGQKWKFQKDSIEEISPLQKIWNLPKHGRFSHLAIRR